jgi:hypothetical protein
VVPVRGSQSNLQVLNLVQGHTASQVLELVDIGASNVLDLSGAENGLAGLVASLKESSDIGGVRTEDIGLKVGNLVETVKAGEKGTPEHYTVVSMTLQ